MKVNLGCGDDYKDRFINIDARKGVKPDIMCDIRYIPLASSSVNYIYCKDVLEHFWNPIEVLNECKRILKSGGEIQIIVPDWHRLGDVDYWRDKDHKQVEKHIYGGHKNPYDQHHTMWTDELAIDRFTKADLHNVEIEHLRDSPLHWHMRIEATA